MSCALAPHAAPGRVPAALVPARRGGRAAVGRARAAARAPRARRALPAARRLLVSGRPHLQGFVVSIANL